MRILYWNVYVGHDPDHVMSELRGLIQDYRPAVIGLGECMRVWDRLHAIKGYRHFVLAETYTGRSDTAVLVRDDVDLKSWRWLEMTKWWRGPKHGKAQGPKRYWAGRIKRHGKLYRISVGHWPFNYAVDETEDRIANWFRTAVPWRKSAHLGDLNMGPDECDRYVRRFRGKHKGVHIDRILYRNMQVEVKDLGKHGSDHRAVLFTVA